ncbi:plasmid partitioning protein RepA [Paracoccus sp. ME4]|uniref:plasmid partitioning protein RepA n=1 Tax=Paracoccus sp. ME4 TaxID=3138066 RepID=UPI00398B14B1
MTVESMIGQAPGLDIVADLVADDERLRTSLAKHIRNVFSPDDRKHLRTFGVAETAALLGVSVSNLRKLHHEGRIPDVAQDARGHRTYSASDIWAAREALARTARNPRQYMPTRSGEEHLQVIGITTFKGGSSKSTTANHLAQRLALKGYRVLMIDMDPQASLTSMMGISLDLEMDETDEDLSIYAAIRYKNPVPMSRVIRKTYFHGLDIAPAALILSEFETETPVNLLKEGDRKFYFRLNDAIEQVADRYDVVIIDCPPQLGFLTLSAMTAATGMIIPVIPNMVDVASLSQFLSMATSMLNVIGDAGVNYQYDFQRYLLCRYEPSDSPQAQMAAFLRFNFGARLMTEPFLKSTAVSDAGLRQMSLYEIDRSQVTRATLDRALDSINKVVDEIEVAMHQAWGRI